MADGQIYYVLKNDTEPAEPASNQRFVDSCGVRLHLNSLFRCFCFVV